MSDEKIEFDELELRMGQVVEVLPKESGGKQLSEVLVIGALPGQSIIISVPESGLFPKMQEGERVIVKVKLAHGVAWFYSTVLFITDVPVFMVYLDFPSDINFKRIRKAPRVAVSLPILVTNLTNLSYSGVAGRITDISTTGAGMELTEYAGKEGDTVNLKGKFSVGNIKRVLSVKCVIRKLKKHSDTRVFYGIEFLNEDENEQLFLFGFIFNAMAFGKVKKIR